jgi:hypothetical protein
MAAEIIPISTQDYFLQNYNPQETNLIPSFEINTVLTDSSYIEYFVYDINKTILSTNYNFVQYTVLANGQSAGSNNEISQIIVDPEQTLINSGFSEGEYVTYFNFLNKKIGSNLEQLFISEISSDRTEIRLDSTILTEFSIVDQTTNFVIERENSPYFLDFYLNFGDNRLVIANNIILDDQDPNNPTILVKLYEALPENFVLNSTLWIVTLVEEPVAYQVNFPIVPVEVIDTFSLKGPNFNLDLKDQINNSTVSLDYASLTTTALTSSQNQLQSLLEEKGLDINIDYSDFNNYVHFSSAQVRLENFYYKVQLLEEYNENINLLNSTTNSPVYTSSSIAEYESKINNIITYFDDYEYYLYYETGSYAWPKTNSQKPYTLAASDSNEVLTWIGNTNPASPYYGGRLLSASLFDNDNKDYLLYTIPEYLRDDPQNKPYETFIQMVGQLYDSIWVYYKDIINKYDNDNRLEYGISKDIVADAIRDFGIKLYQNNFSNEDLYTAFLGLTPQGGLFPFPNITGSLPTPSGFEYVDTLISASNDYMPLDDVNKSLYKRIYHNLPYLLKAKGTLPGLRTLITSYGIPDTVLRINEFGGKDKSNTNDWDDWQNTFNYAFFTSGSNKITTNWVLNPSWNSADDVPATLEFRFKVPNFNTISSSVTTDLLRTDGESRIQLRYTGSGLSTGSYSGSIVNPYYQYTHLDFYPDLSNFPNSSASIYLPFSNEGWWSVMVTRTGDDFTLYAGNNVYEGGENGTQLGFYATSSVNEDSTGWSTSTTVDFMPQQSEMYLQEIRYYNTVLNENAFKDYIMNPSSTEGNTINSSPDQLAFRLSLGGELYTGSNSIHPKVTGSWATTSSFVGYSSASFGSTPIFVPNTEYFFLDQPVVGIKNAISDKIRVETNVIPSGNTLSPFRSLAQNTAASQSYTANTNLLEVAFAPQDEINDDIISQIGYFNIGDYIGDPRLRSSSATSYPDLDALRNEYFEKYTSNYDLNDYIRLIKFFDNSLFKMIKDFVPARTSLASGVVIKQTLLERNKYPQPQVDDYSTIAYYGSGSTNNIPFNFQDISVSGTVAPQWNDYQPGTIENFSGGTGGTFEMFNGVDTSPYGPNGLGPENIYFITQSWYENIQTISGSVLVLHDSQDEFYDGEFSGSNITVTTQSLAQPYPLDLVEANYNIIIYSMPLWDLPLQQISSTYLSFLQNEVIPSQYTDPDVGDLVVIAPYPYKQDTVPSNPFVKINKVDLNGTDFEIPLGQLSQLIIKNIPYTIIGISEFTNHYLYQLAPNSVAATIATSGPLPTEIKNYSISASRTTSLTVNNGNNTRVTYNSSLYNPNNYYTASNGYYTVDTIPNVELSLTMSGTATAVGATAEMILFYKVTGSNVGQTAQTIDNSTSYIVTTATPINFTFSGTLSLGSGPSIHPYWDPTLVLPAGILDPGTSLFTEIQNNSDFYTGNLQITGLNISVNQRFPNTASNSTSVIFEPYIALPNYYNSNYNPLINNAELERLSSIYQAVDYSSGITTPTNYLQLISGSALKAAVQDSNYTSKRVIYPRYNGSKSTSQYLNVWTPGDSGTYGKLPSVDSLKTAVAYCDGIGGWPPEKMNASAIFVRYLIKSDGTVIVPNTTENSLYDIQGNFESGENMLIQYKSTGNQVSALRKIIRGGSGIEPILYTQYGQAPSASWNTTMSFEDITPSPGGSVGNYSVSYKTTGAFASIPANTNTKILFNNVVYGSVSIVSNSYTIPLSAVNEGVSLKLSSKLQYVNLTGGVVNLTVKMYKNSTSWYSEDYTIPANSLTGNINFLNKAIPLFNPAVFTNGDQLSIYVFWSSPTGATSPFSIGGSLIVSQYPAYTNPVTSSGANSIWGWPNKSNYPNVITSSNPTLTQLYGDENVKMTDIIGSGFNNISLPWSLEYGDEFRFEGREDYTYQVTKIFAPYTTGSGDRVSQTGSLEIHFNQPLPVSASTSNFNLDHFIIRRYVDNPSQIVMEGFKPNNSQGPYIVRPEYVSPELNKSIDQFILDLTQKGLLS